MKDFLFSRSHKKHYSNAVVRMGKNNLGFSLVELIIVIAIMAILVAVAIPVLGVFIEKANVANDKQAVTDVMYAIDLGGQSMSYGIEAEQIGEKGVQIPVGMIVMTEEGLFVIGSTANNENALHEMLRDSLGEGYAEKYALKTEGWTSSYASFYTSAGELLEEVDELGTSMIGFMNDLGKLNIAGYGLTSNGDGSLTCKIPFISPVTKPIMSQDYTSSDQLVAQLAKILSDNTDREKFIDEWTNNINTEDQESFAIGQSPKVELKTTREFYSAVRRAYNQCFANYVSAKGADYVAGDKAHSDYSSHVNQIAVYGESGMELIGGLLGMDFSKYGSPEGGDVSFPQTVCDTTFTSRSEGGRFGAFVDCECCQALWNEYAGSDQAKADATAFYDTMVAGASYEANDTNNDGTVNPGEGILDWASNQTDKFAAMYGRLDTTVEGKKSVILITVYPDLSTGLIYGECNTPGVLDE